MYLRRRLGMELWWRWDVWLLFYEGGSTVVDVIMNTAWGIEGEFARRGVWSWSCESSAGANSDLSRERIPRLWEYHILDRQKSITKRDLEKNRLDTPKNEQTKNFCFDASTHGIHISN